VWQLASSGLLEKTARKGKNTEIQKKDFLFPSVILSGLSLLGNHRFHYRLTNRWDTMRLSPDHWLSGMILFIPWVANTSGRNNFRGGSLLKVTKEPAKKLAEETQHNLQAFFCGNCPNLAFINAYVILIGFQILTLSGRWGR
jgi:hypothetical protein